MNLIKYWILPIKTVSEANCCEHWTKKSKRHKSQKNYINLSFQFLGMQFPEKIHIKMIRIAPRFMDDDNLVSSFKYIRDAIAEKLRPEKSVGQADNDANLTWECAQEKGKPQIVRIEFYTQNQL